MKYLGETFDIHCGGVDHIPVHHTNEVAQSECATGKRFARYWLHGEFLNIVKPSDDGAGGAVEKMSKSLDNFLTLQVLSDRGFDPLAYRYLCLQAHYRSELRFSFETLEAAQTGLRRVYSMRTDEDPLADDGRYAEARAEAKAALDDDLNMPQLVGLLNRWGSRRLWLEFDAVLGLDIERRSRPVVQEIPAEVQAIVAERDAARKQKDWARSDALRNRLIEMGYEVADSPKGTAVKKRLL
jgi:cysteinyl-tRNA synthetase